ncbi:GNAT family N-acetyltransferase [Leptospira interrogans]|uniref:Acetyltransferase n=4 Tax=Leptospira interrogans TaxID=173 RepID=Q72P11_LEPIC|nr:MULTISPECIES: GNAT family N-acetyltransferase [Leptospira]AAS71225.1 acetyltransferase [Leptospira interrogans serovar Copenhageni str. Fiocruz L1-130]ARB95356.1 N-acetyltransferase [Leptospira interrogans serovar Copenhageni]KAA5550699.1 GNAT family N-acetyltransferase [Leptospira interrogans serovar Copenhageni]MBO7987666.1 GNAT family N-acetyltransferase [Leptospira interrogans serovar Copenhageni]MBO7991142.1 GNAT family N-acetyltransferase [Leptospira interrogans serovar Copenhageni]
MRLPASPRYLEMHVHVRKARSDDQIQLFPLVSDFATSFLPDPSAFAKAFVQILQQDDAALLVAVHDSHLVGYCLAFDHFTFYANGRVTWIEEIMVQPALRRKGIGHMLMKEAEAWATTRSSKLVALATRRASEFYARISYAESAIYFRKILE